MQDERNYNLSVLGDLQPKIIGFIAAIVSFMTFVQIFINKTSQLLGVGLWCSYLIFIILYFIVPIFLVCLFVVQNRNIINERILKTGWFFEKFLLGALLCFLVLGYIYLAFTDILSIYAGLILIFPIIAGIFSTIVIRIVKANKWQSEDKEYAISTSILLVLISLFLINSYNNLPGDSKGWRLFGGKDNKHALLNKYTIDKNYKGKLDGIIKEMDERTKRNDMEVVNYSFAIEKQIDSLNRAGFEQQLSTVDFLIKESYLKAKKIITKPIDDQNQVDYKNIDTLRQIQDLFNQQADILISRFQHPCLDTASIERIQEKMKFHTNYTNGITFLWTSQILSAGKDFNKEWLPHMLKLQFKGIVWLIFALFILFSLLYHFRKQDRLIRTTTLKNMVQQKANLLKDYIYLIVLLIIPFFKTFTEENISLEKPFLNISLKDIVTDNISPSSEKGHGRDAINSVFVDTILRTTHHDTIHIIVDTSILKKENAKVLESIKLLGTKSIINPSDRKVLNKQVDSLKKQ